MPFIKEDVLKDLLRQSFNAGCTSAHGFDHEDDLIRQEDEAFEKYYVDWIDRHKLLFD